jgi:hypothetical protein
MINYGVDSPLILGVLELGVFFSLIMFGVVALQGYVYFLHSRADQAGLKVLVSVFDIRCRASDQAVKKVGLVL